MTIYFLIVSDKYCGEIEGWKGVLGMLVREGRV